MNITEGCKAQGLDFNDNEIVGVVENIIGFCNVALIRTGIDRVNHTEAYIDKLERIEE